MKFRGLPLLAGLSAAALFAWGASSIRAQEAPPPEDLPVPEAAPAGSSAPADPAAPAPEGSAPAAEQQAEPVPLFKPGADDLPAEPQDPRLKYGDETSVPLTEAERQAGKKARRYGDGTLFRVKTDDGWQIALQYYESSSTEKLYPVLLIHGEGMNRYIYDFGKNHSLARYLSSRGYPVYIVELRGHGMSSVEEAAPSMKTTWVFEDYLKDIQAAMTFATQQFEIDKVLLVGHSTGGTLVYGIMEDERYGKMVAGAVTLGAPLLYNHPNDTLLALFNNRDKLFQDRSLVSVKTRHAYYLPAPFPKNTETLLGVLFFNDFFLNDHRIERFLDHGVEDVRVDILRQMALWLQEERVFGTEDAGIRYLDDLNLIKAPVCLMSGWRDNFVEPETVAQAADLIEPGLRKLISFGKVNGHNDNYGHLGYLLNDYAPEDVYPEVGKCLQEWTDRASVESMPAVQPSEAPGEEEQKAPAPEQKIEEKPREGTDLKPEEVPFKEITPGF